MKWLYSILLLCSMSLAQSTCVPPLQQLAAVRLNSGVVTALLCYDPNTGVVTLPTGASLSPITTNQFTLTNTGIFTNTQQNDYNVSNINSVNIGTEYSSQQAGNFATEAKVGAINVPSSATVHQANAVAGYVINNSTSVAGVGSYGQSRCAANSTKCWGANFLVFDNSSLTGVNLNGDEQDINVNNLSTTGQAFNCNGTWTVQNNNLQCLNVSKPAGFQWNFGITFAQGATPAPSSSAGGIYFNPVASGVNQVSQGIAYISNDPVSGTHTGTQNLTAAGTYQIVVPGKTLAFDVNGNLSLPGAVLPAAVTATSNLRGKTVVADQGTACTNGELSLSAGWQSTGSATITNAAGLGQTCEWTLTTGTTTAANPTITDTLTNVLPSASTVCFMIITGGNRTAAASDSFDQTTLSATAPIFTFQGTPTAGGKTYQIVRSCGP